MYICFANTAAEIYGGEVIQSDLDKVLAAQNENPSGEYEYPLEMPYVHNHFTSLGSISLHRDGCVVVDRYQQQVTTQLNIDSLLDTLVYLATRYYHATGTLTIYLPRMASNLYDEALIQYKFQTMLTNGKRPTCPSKKPNIRLSVYLKPVWLVPKKKSRMLLCVVFFFNRLKFIVFLL